MDIFSFSDVGGGSGKGSVIVELRCECRRVNDDEWVAARGLIRQRLIDTFVE